MNYKEKLKKVETLSLDLGLNPNLDLKLPITGDKIQLFKDFCSKALIKMLIERFGKGDWGQQSIEVIAQTFDILQKHKVPSELVYGEVKVNGVNEFGTTTEALKKELTNGLSESTFPMHIWINIGKDYIIDPTLSSRLHKRHDSNCSQNMIFTGKSNTLKKQKLEYIPMLAGAKYLDITKGIPLTYQANEQMTKFYHQAVQQAKVKADE